MSGTIEVVRGMRDVLPPEARAAALAEAAIMARLASYGYTRVDLPVIEARDLYLRKLGEDLAGKVYEFSFGGRALALRPEWTASVLRAYVGQLQDQPLPLRLSYAGPVFRYERPQRHTYRQFTQVGVELLGGPAPRGDAEVLAMACAGLEAARVGEYRILIGHIGLLRELLGQLGLTERTQDALVWGMERMRQGGPEALRARLGERLGEPAPGLAPPPGLSDADAAAWLLDVLGAMEIDLRTGTRPPQAVIGRLLRKLQRGDEGPAIERAIDLLARLSALRGSPAEVLAELDRLLAAADLRAPASAELRGIVDLLSAAHQIDPARIEVDLGLGRGLHYYTGMIFEIYGRDQLQLCGGGRYDDLVAALGGSQSTPAVGFAYGLERVVAASSPARPTDPPEVLVAPVSDEDYAYAVAVADRLRAVGFVASLDLRGRTVANNLRDATRRDIGFVAIIGAEERRQGTLVWRDLNGRSERRLSLSEVDTLANR